MAPGAQTVSEFVSGRLSNGTKVPMTLEERRQKMREDMSYMRGSRSPKPTRELHRFGSFSSAGRPATSFEDRPMFHKPGGGDRWDTDTEHLDDSTIDGLDYAQARSFGDLARSPAPEESTEVSELSEVSEITDDEDKYSVSVSVRTEPVNHHTTSQPLQSLNGALSGHGQNTWTNTTRTKVINRAPSGSISGNDYHQKYFQTHNFRQGFTVGTSNAIPFHTRTGHSPSLRMRDTSAPPLRSRAISPIMGERVNGHRANGHSTGHIPNDTIDEEYSPPLEVGQARTIRITRQPSISNMSQASGISRASSVSDLRGMRSPGGTRFRTKRSHVMGRKRNRSLMQELDYTPTELANMEYRTLAEESFDDNPKARNMKPVIEFPADVDSLEKKCEFVRKLPEKETGGAPPVEETRTPQEVFFASLTIDEYDECGELIVEQLSALMGQLRKLRRAKRKAAMEMEDEVAKRQESVSTKMENLQSELTRLKKSGQEALAAAASKV